MFRPVLALLAGVAIACAAPGDGQAGPRLSPEALRDPPREIPLEIDQARILVRDGRFEAERYTIQGTQIRLIFETEGGPYSLTIERVVPRPQHLAANAQTLVGFAATEPGDFTMRISETEATATLTIRAPASP